MKESGEKKKKKKKGGSDTWWKDGVVFDTFIYIYILRYDKMYHISNN